MKLRLLFLLSILCFLPALSHAQTAGGVKSINGVPGPFNFTGSGVSCVGVVCTFSGGGGGGVSSFTGDGGLLSNSASTGAVTATLANAAQNSVFAGPGTGGSGAPSYRALIAADIPSLSSVYLPLGGGTLTGAVNLPYVNGGSLVFKQTGGVAPMFIGVPSATAAIMDFCAGSPDFLCPFYINGGIAVFANSNTANQGYIYFSNSGYEGTNPTASLSSLYYSNSGEIDFNLGGTDTHDAEVRAGTFNSALYQTATHCASAASPAVCAAAAAGFVNVAAAATTIVVDTTAVTATSTILVQEDASLGAALSVTCNTTAATAPPTISARTAGTSFTITTTLPTTNPRCFSYSIIN